MIITTCVDPKTLQRERSCKFLACLALVLCGIHQSSVEWSRASGGAKSYPVLQAIPLKPYTLFRRSQSGCALSSPTPVNLIEGDRVSTGGIPRPISPCSHCPSEYLSPREWPGDEPPTQ